MSEPILQKRVGKAIIVYLPTMQALALRLEEGERMKRSLPDLECDEWHVPGGSVERQDEGSTEAAAVRESFEETGLDVEVVRKAGEASWDAAPASFATNFYPRTIAEDRPELPDVSIENESADLAWVTEGGLNSCVDCGLTTEAGKFIREGLQKFANEVSYGK